MRRVLVVEWGERIAVLMRATLVPRGWSVDVAADSITAMNLLRDTDFDLIVIDLWLPGDGALEVVRVLHDNDVLASVLLLADREHVCAAFTGLDGAPCSPAH